jgi:2'-5' RNA ligase
VPAHITLLYPFIPPSLIDARQILELGELFADTPSLDISFNEIRRWPKVLYLHPSPSAPVIALMGRIMDAYPIYPPYGRENLEAVPHLTVAQADHPHMLDEIGRLFNQAAVNVLPIVAHIEYASLAQKRAGSWEITHRFPLSK